MRGARVPMPEKHPKEEEYLIKKRSQCVHGSACRWHLEVCKDCNHFKAYAKPSAYIKKPVNIIQSDLEYFLRQESID